MKKDILMAVGLAVLVVSTVAILVAVFSPDGKAPPPGQQFDPLDPPHMAVLAGTNGALEVLVKRRYPKPENNAKADRNLARRLGIDPRKYAFLEVLVLNTGEAPRLVDMAKLVLLKVGGQEIPVEALRALAGRGATTRLLLAVHAPDPSRPLERGRLRRGLVVVPRGLQIDGVEVASLAGVTLKRRSAATADVERYLDRPQDPLLLAVLGDEEEASGEGKGQNR